MCTPSTCIYQLVIALVIFVSSFHSCMWFQCFTIFCCVTKNIDTKNFKLEHFWEIHFLLCVRFLLALMKPLLTYHLITPHFMLWRTTSNCVRVYVFMCLFLTISLKSFRSSSFNKINGGWGWLTFTTISLCACFNCTHLPCRCLHSFLCLTRLWQLWETGACFYTWKAPLMNSCLSRGEITGQSILQLLRIEVRLEH